MPDSQGWLRLWETIMRRRNNGARIVLDGLQQQVLKLASSIFTSSSPGQGGVASRPLVSS